MTRSLLLLLSMVPGASAILLGRGLFGSLLMLGGLHSLAFAYIGFAMWYGAGRMVIAWSGLVIGGSCLLVSVLWTAVETSPRRNEKLRRHADRALRTALRAYLRDRLRAAGLAVELGLRRSGDDVDLLFVGWQVALRQGDGRRARRLLRRLRHADEDRKWGWEVDRERKGRRVQRVRKPEHA